MRDEPDPLEEGFLPEWMGVYADMMEMFAESKKSSIERMFDKGELSESNLVDNAMRRLDDADGWMAAAKIIHDRFGTPHRDIDLEVGEQSKFNITTDDDTPINQWYVSTGLELLLRHHTTYDTRHEWLDAPDGASEGFDYETSSGRAAFIVAENAQEPDAFGD